MDLKLKIRINSMHRFFKNIQMNISFALCYLLLCIITLMNKPYRQRYTLQQRIAKVKSFQQSDPDKIMVIVQRHPKSKLPDLQNSKFLTFKNFKYGQVKSLVEKRIKQKMGKDKEGKQSYYLFVAGTVPSIEESMQVIYDKYKDKDGVLYICYQEQQSFG